MLIVIEGCFGVGKTTVATALASHRNRPVVLENFEANPFLPAFYRNPAENALETEFAFLLLHFHQLKPFLQTAAGSEIIADFHLGKDLIYADLNLVGDDARRLFHNLYDFCAIRVPAPDLLILLSASTALLVERIRSRNRDIEIGVDPDYCDRLNHAYEEFFLQYPGTKLRVDMNAWDFVKDPSRVAQLSFLADQEIEKP
jgi:deoxyguanosine kinase